MAIILGEGPYHIELWHKDIGGRACRSPLKSLLKNVINARDMCRRFINQAEDSIPLLARGPLCSGDWILLVHSPRP